MKLIFTLFLKINEIVCAVVFSHQSRYKLLLLIVKDCGSGMQNLLEIGLLLFLAVDTRRGQHTCSFYLLVSARTCWSFYLPFSYVFRISLVLSWIPATCFLSERERISCCAVEQMINHSATTPGLSPEIMLLEVSRPFPCFVKTH